MERSRRIADCSTNQRTTSSLATTAVCLSPKAIRRAPGRRQTHPRPQVRQEWQIHQRVLGQKGEPRLASSMSAHGIAIDAKGLLWVTSREDQRIQIFDQDGKYVPRGEVRGPAVLAGYRQTVHLPWSLTVSRVSFSSWIWTGKVLAVVGSKPGAAGTWGEIWRSALHRSESRKRRDLHRPIRSIEPCRNS